MTSANMGPQANTNPALVHRADAVQQARVKAFATIQRIYYAHQLKDPCSLGLTL